MKSLPLSSVRALDFTHVLSGPTCTMVLADLGAEVIKLEPPAGENSRAYGPFVNGASAYFNSVNRNKLGICIDMKSAGGKQVVWDLVKVSDVLVENFRPGTLNRLGFDYESVKQRNPDIVYASISGFGHTGPYRDRPAYDLMIQSMSGLMSITGEPGGNPVRVGASFGDIIAGYHAAISILAALVAKGKTGAGARVDVAMFDSMVYSLENAIARCSAGNGVPGPLGSAHPSITPFQAFRTKDSHIVVAAGNDALWKELCSAIGRPDLAGHPDFATNEMRTRHRAELAEVLQQVLASRTYAEWADLFQQHGVPHAPLNTIADVMADPQAKARNMVQKMAHPEYGDMLVAGIPFKITGVNDTVRTPAPVKGEHSRHVLQDILNYPEDTIRRLAADGAIVL